MTSARIKIKTSETVKIFTFRKNAPRTEGLIPEPMSDCQRCCGLMNRSATISLPGDSTTITAITAKKSTVLALDTSTPRFPSAREPRPASAEGPGAPGPPPSTLLLEAWDVQVLLQVLLLQLFQGSVLLHRGERLVHAADQRVALLQQYPELLVARVLAYDGRAVYLEVAQVNRGNQVGDEDVDLAALQGGFGVVGGVEDFRVLRRLYRLVYEVQAGRADLGPDGQVLEVGDALGVGGGVVLHHEDALGVVEVALRNLYGLFALRGYGDLVDVEVEVFGARRVGLVEGLDDPLYGEVHTLGDLLGHVAFVARVVFWASLEPRRVGRPVGGDRQHALRVERRVFHVAPVRGPRLLSRLSAAACQQQGDQKEPDQDDSLSHALLRSTWHKETMTRSKNTGPSIDTPPKRCN